MWRAVGDGFTGASPAAPRRAAMAASALRFFTLWRRHDRQRTEPPDSRSAPHGADSTVWAPFPFWASRASVASAGASRAGSGVLRRPASWRKRHQLQPGQMQCLQSGRPAATHSRHLRLVGGLGVTHSLSDAIERRGARGATRPRDGRWAVGAWEGLAGVAPGTGR